MQQKKQLRRNMVGFLASLMLVGGLSVNVGAVSYTFTIIDYPGAVWTFAEGINDADQVVGGYEDSSGNVHGFLYDGGSATPWTTIDFPGAVGTQAKSINNSGKITGGYVDSSGVEHGFLYDGATASPWTTLDYPGAVETIPKGINNADKIVGEYSDSSHVEHGFLYDPVSPSPWSNVDYPGSIESSAEEINDANKFVGGYVDTNNKWGSFLYDPDSSPHWSAIDYPGAVETETDGINDADIVVGDYDRIDLTQHGYVYDGITYDPLDVPGAVETSPEEINNANTIVGGFHYSDGIDHGFIATPSPIAEVEAFVTRFYQQCLNRAPDSAGLAYWVDSLLDGSLTGADVAWGFVFSQEFVDLNTSNEDYLTVLYRAFFDREADAGGWNYWLDQFNNGASRDDVLNGFISAQEFVNLCDAYGIIAFRTDPRALVEAFVTRFYQQCLNRAPDTGGLAYWVDSLLDGSLTGSDVAWGFVFSTEFRNLNTTDQDYLTVLYRAFFDRQPDPGGLAYWLDQFANGANREDVLDGFIYAQEFVDLCDSYGIIPFNTVSEGFTSEMLVGKVFSTTETPPDAGLIQFAADGTGTEYHLFYDDQGGEVFETWTFLWSIDGNGRLIYEVAAPETGGVVTLLADTATYLDVQFDDGINPPENDRLTKVIPFDAATLPGTYSVGDGTLTFTAGGTGTYTSSDLNESTVDILWSVDSEGVMSITEADPNETDILWVYLLAGSTPPDTLKVVGITINESGGLEDAFSETWALQ